MRIAIVGSGISGNSAAWALHREHDVTLYEKRERLGGHSATVDIDYQGTPLSVDTGFIVYNELNYPLMTKLFAHLGVETTESDMSFALSALKGRQEWSGQSLNTVFAKRSNLLSPRFLRMLRDIFRFNGQCPDDLASGRLAELSLGDYLAQEKFSNAFIDDYLLPMGAAIWSTPLADVKDYPAENFVAFFKNHRLINRDRPQWRTVSNGSRSYVEKLLAPLKGRIRTGTKVLDITRQDDLVFITDSSGETNVYDHVILAGHTDQTFETLRDMSNDEREVLSGIRYRPNDVYLHRDESLMPKRKSVWASWNYIAGEDASSKKQVTVSYWMNRLQGIDESKPLFVTLNPSKAPREDLTFGHFVYDHPQFDRAAINAQKRLPTIQGKQNTWFCGAWTGHGFHEDGLRSGLTVARQLGAVLPWEETPSPQAVLEAAE